ncbi:hypothetical protein QCA50_007323 [Cerrena zonata]|uniref:Uncharacterized protein n=1 Tax=Cerrena zonata TaxID=2478898 RepID=A0AAW0G9Q2_9APHY
MIYDRATISGGFIGCATNFNSTLDTCCPAVGSTPTFVNGSYGCPFVYDGNLKTLWDQCVSKDPNAAGSICSDADSSSSPSVGSPKKAAIIGMMIMMLGALSSMV